MSAKNTASDKQKRRGEKRAVALRENIRKRKGQAKAAAKGPKTGEDKKD